MTNASQPVLLVEGLKTQFATRAGIVKAVDDVSFSIERGQIMGLVGESGSGKSMTGYSLIGLIDPPGRVVAGRLRLALRTASIICVSMRRTGFSVIIGSWKIIATLRPRIVRQVASLAPTSSCPASLIEPATMRPGGSISPMIARPVTVLPEPDSPTSPITSPR